MAENLRDRSFDSDWCFLRGDAQGAENPAFDDSLWRRLDVPHDWSIEDLPPKENADSVKTTPRVGPFDPVESPSTHFTGNTVGGIGWYRKHFTVSAANQRVAVRFDGVYMNCEVWINGQLLGEHPNGYTGFGWDLTPYLKSAGGPNVIAVRVRNEGRNSRWYSGSGIYRHTWLTFTEPVHVPINGVFVTTPEVSKDKAIVKIAVEVTNATGAQTLAVIRSRVRDAKGDVVNHAEGRLQLDAMATATKQQEIEVQTPQRWSIDSPILYSAEVEIVVNDRRTDVVVSSFGIRKIEVDAERGFRLNGEMLKLKGGCIHHDNGPLGSVAIDRAEERKVELLKANGFNAIRSAHNPPSSVLLDACDRLGMLVIDEAFDQWNISKERNPQDYHRFFKDWSERDIASMVRRDRNHPSVIMWSIGNEIPEQFRDPETGKRLREQVLSHDPSRVITQAISTDWGKVAKNWDMLSDPAFGHLDVAGYNYLMEKYEADHARHPERVMMGTESYPKDFFENWSRVETYPYLIGDFVWTAMDYLGEAGIGHSVLSNEKNSFFMPWPWFNAWCGDLDLCGFKKPQSLYRDVVWRRSPIEMLVHAPIPIGLHEIISGWGWPNEVQSWNWLGQENKLMQVTIYSRCDHIRLELNGKVVGSKPVSAESQLTARFDVPYAAGELRAFGLIRGKVVAQTLLKTTGRARKLKLTADRTIIRADRNDLSYITVEVVDADGQRVPDAEIPVRFSVSGAGELAAHGSSTPNDPASFRGSVGKFFQGRCLAILQPKRNAGSITLQAEAEGLEPAIITVTGMRVLTN